MPFSCSRICRSIKRPWISRISSQLAPKAFLGYGFYFLVDQLEPCSRLSIATNIAEGNGRFTKADRKHFFTIARGSTQECVPLLEVAMRRGFVTAQTHAELKSQLEEIAKMLSGLINGLENRDH